MDATEAKALGLVEAVSPPGEVFEAAVRDAREIAHKVPAERLAAAKEALREAVRTPGPAGIDREKELFIALFGTPDQREGMRAFIEKRPPTFQGN